MSWSNNEHVERELAGAVARIELLEELKQRREDFSNVHPSFLEPLEKQVDELQRTVAALVKIVKRQQAAIEELSL
jgi:hypothetical protein